MFFINSSFEELFINFLNQHYKRCVQDTSCEALDYRWRLSLLLFLLLHTLLFTGLHYE